MYPAAVDIIPNVFLAISLVSIAYLAFAIWRVVLFGRPRDYRSSLYRPPVTVLKPLCGNEPNLYENLRSFCKQDYPAYEIVFGVSNPADGALPVVQRIIDEFPERSIAVVVDERSVGMNLKVNNLANMYQRASHDIIVVSDSDMRVGRNYLAAITASFRKRSVGAVTCLYRGTAVGGTPSTLLAMFINDWFVPSVLVASTFRNIGFCFGATMAVTREALQSIGGFEALGPYLADDYMLGRMISARGYKVRLSSYVPENLVSETSYRNALLHELRWAKTIRSVRPIGYTFSFLTDAIPISLLFLVTTGFDALGIMVFANAIVFRIVLHYAVHNAIRVRGFPKPWLIPIRDLLRTVVWVISFFGGKVQWRNRKFTVRYDGTVTAKDA